MTRCKKLNTEIRVICSYVQLVLSKIIEKNYYKPNVNSALIKVKINENNNYRKKNTMLSTEEDCMLILYCLLLF